ncbi:MAG: hypothetical protein HQ596_07600 [Candidatus Saganbacteria bacterium]|nr:hypothetical protein [Candidatus Saganbacteria bacterium]
MVSLLNIVFLSWFILLLPDNIRRFRQFIGINLKESWLNSDACVSLSGLILVVVAGLGVAFLGINTLLLFVVIGAVFFLLSLKEFILNVSLRQSLMILVILLVYSLWLITMFWSVHMGPLFIEGILIGQGQIDPLFHSALAGMLKIFNIASTGLNGIPYIGYHFGSHWIFAQLSFLLRIPLLTFYQIGFPIIFIPLFIQSMLFLALDIRKHILPQGIKDNFQLDFKFWGIFLITQIGFLPKVVYGWLGSSVVARYASESYTLAIIFSLLLMALCIDFWGRGPAAKLRVKDKLFLILIVPFLIGLITWSKISVGILIIVLAAYLFLRLKLYKKIIFAIGFIASLLVFGVIFLLISKILFVYNPSGATISISLFDNIRGKQFYILPFYFLLYYFIAFVFIILRLYRAGIDTWDKLRSQFLQNKLIDVETLVVLCFVGFLPGALIFLPSGGAGYFSDYQGVIAAILLLAYLPIFWPKNIRINIVLKIALIFVVLPFVVAMLFNVFAFTYRILRDNIDIRIAILSETESVSGSKSIASLYSADKLQKAMENNKRYPLLQALRKLNGLPLEEKRRSLVFVSHKDTLFWTTLAKQKGLPFLVPALTGMAMIDGVPLLENVYYREYGFNLYQLRKKPQTAADRKIGNLLSKVREKGFSQLILLNAESGEIKKYE